MEIIPDLAVEMWYWLCTHPLSWELASRPSLAPPCSVLQGTCWLELLKSSCHDCAWALALQPQPCALRPCPRPPPAAFFSAPTREAGYEAGELQKRKMKVPFLDRAVNSSSAPLNGLEAIQQYTRDSNKLQDSATEMEGFCTACHQHKQHYICLLEDFMGSGFTTKGPYMLYTVSLTSTRAHNEFKHKDV